MIEPETLHWIAGALAVLLVGGLGFGLWRRSRRRGRPATPTPYDRNSFTGIGTAHGAILLGYGSEGHPLCVLSTWLTHNRRYCHTGIFDANQFEADNHSAFSRAIITANHGDDDLGNRRNGPTHETVNYWRQFRRVEELLPNATAEQRAQAVAQAATYRGRFSVLFSTLANNDDWYCSKLAYRAYHDLGIAIAAVGRSYMGNWISPGDIAKYPANRLVRVWTDDQPQ